MPSKSKAKGNSAELELCKFFHEVFGGSFIRVPNSGAYIGGKNAFRREFLSEGQVRHAKGDIIPPGFMPKFVIESKFYADFPFHSLMTAGKVSQLDSWIDQTLDCVETGDNYYVAFKINRKGWFIVFPENTSTNYTIGNHCVYNNDKGKFIVTDLKEFVMANKDAILKLSA